MGNFTGGCLCGAIRYEVKGQPKFSLSCHCRDCQYVSGGAPAHVMIMRSNDVAITRGAPIEHWTISMKSNRIARLFCEQCGTPLFAKNEMHPEFLSVKVGSLDDPSTFRPQANIWTRSAQPWHYFDAAIPHFEHDPEISIVALIEVARSLLVRFGRSVGLLPKQGERRPIPMSG
jgi:hypothetical protein